MEYFSAWLTYLIIFNVFSRKKKQSKRIQNCLYFIILYIISVIKLVIDTVFRIILFGVKDAKKILCRYSNNHQSLNTTIGIWIEETSLKKLPGGLLKILIFLRCRISHEDENSYELP